MTGKLFKNIAHISRSSVVVSCSVAMMCVGFAVESLKPSTASGEGVAVGEQEETPVYQELPQSIISQIRTEPKERTEASRVYVDGEYLATLSADDASMLQCYINGEINSNINSFYATAYLTSDVTFENGSYEVTELDTYEEVENLLFEGENALVSLESQYIEFEEEAIGFETVTVENPLLPKGESFVSQEGKEGTSVTATLISELDGEVVKELVITKATTAPPVNEVIQIGTATFNNLMWPVGAGGGWVSSEYGYRTFDDSFHKGIDICGVDEGTDIYAVYAGTVIRSETNKNGYGEFVVIDHGNGYHTAYAHMSSRDVQIGDKVLAGDRIGGIGTTGQSTGVHLHFEVRYGSEFADPGLFLERSTKSPEWYN